MDVNFPSQLPPRDSDAMEEVISSPRQPSALTASVSSSGRDYRLTSRVDAQYLMPFRPVLTTLWHPEAGVFVSPNMTFIPEVTRPKFPGDIPNYSTPSLLDDRDIYQAFRPRTTVNTGILFGRLNVTREELAHEISCRADGKFGLDPNRLESWHRLESALTTATSKIFNIANIPYLAPPKMPIAWGYQNSHKTEAQAIYCAVRSRDAFIDLGAYLSFGISLYLNENGSPEHAITKLLSAQGGKQFGQEWLSLLAASHIFNFEQNFRVGGIVNPYESYWACRVNAFVRAKVPVWIQWGKISASSKPIDTVGLRKFFPPPAEVEAAIKRANEAKTMQHPTYRFDPSLRTNNFYALDTLDDPLGYMSFRDVPAPLTDFTRTVPTSESSMYSNLLPPSSSLVMPSNFAPSAPSFRQASSSSSFYYQQPSSSSLSSHQPSSKFHVPSSSLPTPHQPTSASSSHQPTASTSSHPQVSFLPEKNNTKAALEALENFFAELKSSRDRYLRVETLAQKEQRLSREKHASGHKLAKKCTVFKWVEQTDGTYRREKLDWKEADDEWSDFTRNQRRYTSHMNHWDLCPQLPRFSEERPGSREPDSDNGSDHSFILPLKGKKRAREEPATGSNEEMEKDGSKKSQRLSPPGSELVSFLRDYFGYDVYSSISAMASSTGKGKTKALQFPSALLALSFEDHSTELRVQDSILNLISIISDQSSTFRQLPAAFDYSPNHPNPVSLVSDTLDISIISGERTLYIISKKGRLDGHWVIITEDSSTVMLIFRKGWHTVEVIAQNLVRRGVPFFVANAVEGNATIPESTEPGSTLGLREFGWKPSTTTYKHYVEDRNKLLRGPKGRAALLHGGIIARIARDVLDPLIVLDGPVMCNYVIGTHGRFSLVTDQLSIQDLDVICGSYFVKMLPSVSMQEVAQNPSSIGVLSWWPQSSVWKSQHVFIKFEWTPLAERFYSTHLSHLEKSDDKPNSMKTWKSRLRKQNNLTATIESGIRHYQGGYVTDFLHRHA